jgi:hypothetical protein
MYLSEPKSGRGQGLRAEKRRGGGGDGGRQGLERGYKSFALAARTGALQAYQMAYRHVTNCHFLGACSVIMSCDISHLVLSSHDVFRFTRITVVTKHAPMYTGFLSKQQSVVICSKNRQCPLVLNRFDADSDSRMGLACCPTTLTIPELTRASRSQHNEA